MLPAGNKPYQILDIKFTDLSELFVNLSGQNFTGYIEILCDDHKASGRGVVLFQNGEMPDAFYFIEEKPLLTGIKALTQILAMAKTSGRITIVETPSKLIKVIQGMYLGKAILEDASTKIIDFKGLYKHYHKEIKNGFVYVRNPKDEEAFIVIEDGNWNTIEISPERFMEILKSDGALLNLYHYDTNSFPEVNLPLNILGTAKEKIEEARQLLKSELSSKYGDDIKPVFEEIDKTEMNTLDLEILFNKIYDYLTLFVDGTGKKTKEHLTEIREKIEDLL